jgi:hypothetical protein
MNHQHHLDQAQTTAFFTFVKTAIEANELPKLIPTTGGSFDTAIGASALPFGTDFVVIARDIELRWLIPKEKNSEKKFCTRHL